MFKTSILAVLVLIALLACPCVAKTTGDPLDSNDGTLVFTSVDDACRLVYLYPQCVPCWTTCYFAIMAVSLVEGNWDRDF